MKRGIDASTVILVAVLLVVLVLVGKVVNPPSAKGEHDHDHSEASSPPAAQKPLSGPDGKPMKPMTPSSMAQGPNGMGKGMPPMTSGPPKGSGMPSMTSGPPKGYHPSAPDGMDPSLWQEHEMGVVTPKPNEKK